jgi:hypothetical protein
MTLHIAKLSTHCRAPRGREALGALVNSLARETLALELFERLGPSLDRQAPVVRIRRLEVKLALATQDLEPRRLVGAWAAALARALHEALARPDDAGETLRRFESRAAYVAAAIAYLLRGETAGRAWQFPEIEARPRLPAAIAALDLLLDSGPLLGDVLEALDWAGDLQKTLGLFDEVGLERLLCTVAEPEQGDSALTGPQFVAVAAALLALRAPPAGGEMTARRRAIELWLHLERQAPLRGVFYAIKLLLLLLEEPALLFGPASESEACAADDQHPAEPLALPAALAEQMARFPPWCETLRRELARDLPIDAAAVLEQVRAITPSAAPKGGSAEARWKACDCAGLLLLYPVIKRLGWFRLYRDSGFGPRAFQALVAGAAMRLLWPWSPGEKIDEAPALLAGMLAEADRLGLAQALEQAPPSSLFPQAQDWSAALEAAAEALAQAFASRLRGFNKAGRETIVRHFMRLPGRVLIDEKELRVALAPSAWGIVLHISGADDPLAEVEWLDRRAVTYVLEGL